MNDFSQRARTWDANPVHAERSAAIAENLLKRIPVKPEMTALDFGAGTGILSFMLANRFASITMMDTASGMVSVMQEKVAEEGATNLKPVHFDLVQEAHHLETFDVVFTQMVLHHIPDIDGILSRFHTVLRPGGYVAIADLYPEDGSFHGKDFDGHLGFDVKELAEKLEHAGFKNAHAEPCFVFHKMTEKGLTDFPVFLMIASK
jgi:2-polyprenyl-3-methyl-5-hydroxy-6-metoxy-1,4-benzoquinol methylase